MFHCLVNLAVSLTHVNQNLSVGLLDADVYGPSVPKMMNLTQQPEVSKRMLQFCLYVISYIYVKA